MILWIEDRPETINEHINFCDKNALKHKIVSTTTDFIQKLSESTHVCLIIIDIMLYGVKNLENINIFDSDTDGGFNAGWVIIERILRADQKHVTGHLDYYNIPVLIVTSRPFNDEDKIRIENLNQKCLNNNWLPVTAIEKSGFCINRKTTYELEFKKIVKKHCIK